LGVVGAACNFFYVENQARDYRKIDFISLDAPLNQGDRFQESQFKRVGVPASAVGDLDKTAVKWEARESIVGLAAIKNYNQGEIILSQDTLTPPQRPLNEIIGTDERVIWLPIDARGFNPAQVNPGDEVSFKIPGYNVTTGAGGANSSGMRSQPDEVIGPFRILALGNRRGRREVQQASGVSAGAENTIAVSVKIQGTKLEPKGERITEILAQTGFRGVVVLLHPSSEK
jgi:Flp pilus assembly protein CpaB